VSEKRSKSPGQTAAVRPEKGGDKRRKSDRPSPDQLAREREAFLQTFLRKGAEFTEELVRENERLRRQAIDLEAENAELRTQLASDTAMRDLLRKIEQLERDKKQLLSHMHEAEAVSTRVADRYREMESELGNLAYLYVAGNQLHSTLRLSRAVRHLKELLQQLVGAKDYALYFAEPSRAELARIAAEGELFGPERVVLRGEGASLETPAGYIEVVQLTGEARIESGLLADCGPTKPAAVVPMRFDDQVVGVIVVYTVFEQKDRFVQVDFELFKMLSSHAATALAGALLFFAQDGKLPGLEPFAHLEQ